MKSLSVISIKIGTLELTSEMTAEQAAAAVEATWRKGVEFEVEAILIEDGREKGTVSGRTEVEAKANHGECWCCGTPYESMPHKML